MLTNQTYELVAVEELREHPSNPRRGDVDIIAESIKANGFYGVLYVQRSTKYILAGNHRFKAAQRVGMKEVPVIWLDVDDATALRILLADNKTADEGGYDNQVLAELLQSVDPDDLLGTGYSQQEMDALIQSVSVQQIVESGGDSNIDSAFFEPEFLKAAAKKQKCPTCGRVWGGKKKGDSKTTTTVETDADEESVESA